MRHLKNPEERPKTPAIERAGHGPVGQVHEDTKALIGQSIADNTRLAYAAALNGLDAAIPLDRQDDARIADRLAALYRDGRSPATIALVVAAIQFRAKIAGTRSPVGEVARRTLAGIRKEGRERGRGQARAVTYDQVIRMQAVAGQPRRRGRGMESPDVATRRGAEDAALHPDDLVRAAVIEARRARAFVVGHLLGDFQLAAVAQVFGDAGGPEAVATDFRLDAGVAGAAADHPIHIRLSHGLGREMPGPTFRGGEEPGLGVGGAGRAQRRGQVLEDLGKWGVEVLPC